MHDLGEFGDSVMAQLKKYRYSNRHCTYERQKSNYNIIAETETDPIPQ